jgi:hypothetical protein
MNLDERRFEALWTRYLAGEALSEDEQAALEQLAAASADLRARAREDDRLHHTLASFGRSAAPEDAAAFTAAVRDRLTAPARAPAGPAPRRRARWLPAAFTLAAAAAVILIVARAPRRPHDPRPSEPAATAQAPRPASSPAPPASPAPSAEGTLAAPRGEVFVIGRGPKAPATEGMPVRPGETVATVGTHSRATLRLDGPRALALAGNTIVGPIGPGDAEAAATVFVATGLVQVAAPDAARPLRLVTPHAEALAHGAIELEVAGGKTRLRVSSGAATLRSNRQGGAQPVRAGQQALTAGEGESGAVQIIGAGGRRVLLVTGDKVARDPADRLVLARLRSLGFEVTTRPAASAGIEEDARDARLVAISSTVDSATLGPLFRDLAVPLVVWEPALYDHLGMVGPRDPEVKGAVPGSEIVIGLETHPLAAGLSGRVRVADRLGNHYLSQGTPAPTALWVAAMPGDPTLATVFAYEKGMPMAEIVAPARRVGLFVSDLTPPHMTAAGWRLFDAAIRWAAGED